MDDYRYLLAGSVVIASVMAVVTFWVVMAWFVAAGMEWFETILRAFA